MGNMNWYNSYQNKVNGNNIQGTIRDVNIESFINEIKLTFKESPSYFQVTKNTDTTTLYDAWIQEIKDTASRDGIDKKSIILYPDQILNRGDYINWIDQNETFLLMEKNVSPYYDNGVMERCNNKIVFKNNKGNIVNYPIVLAVIGRMYLDIVDSKSVILPKDTYLISVQSNEDTLQIIESMRFIISGDAYKVMGKSKVVINGVIQCKLQSDLLRASDNPITGLADQTIPQVIIPTNLSINGTATPKISSVSNTYTILNNTNNNTFTWSLLDINNNPLATTIAQITSQTGTSAVVKINATVGGRQFKIQCICNESSTITVPTLICSTNAGF